MHVYKTFFPETKGGGEQVIYTICKGLRKHGVESKVICLTKDREKSTSYFQDIEVVRYPYTINLASCPVSIELLYNFRREIEWADIIYYHYPWPFADFLSLLAPKDKIQIVTYHSDIVKQKLLKVVYYPLEQWFLGKVNRIIATSPNYINLSCNLQKFREKTTIIPIGIDPKLYPAPDENECKKIQKKFGKFILFVGQLRYYKGLHLLIKAAKDLDTNIVLIGKGKEELRLKQIAKSEMVKNIYFLGSLENDAKVNYLKSCYALILPSHLKSEAFGISLLEGAMFAKPLISCKIGTGVEFINQHMQTGLVTKPTSEDIRDAITKLLKDESLAKKLGNNAKLRFKKMFTAQSMIKDIWKEIETLHK